MVKYEVVNARSNKVYLELYLATQRFLEEHKDSALTNFAEEYGGLDLTCLPSEHYSQWRINSKGLSSEPQITVRAHDRVIDIREGATPDAQWPQLATALAQEYEGILESKGFTKANREFRVRRF